MTSGIEKVYKRDATEVFAREDYCPQFSILRGFQAVVMLAGGEAEGRIRPSANTML
jgi:hypothetical protein